MKWCRIEREGQVNQNLTVALDGRASMGLVDTKRKEKDGMIQIERDWTI